MKTATLFALSIIFTISLATLSWANDSTVFDNGHNVYPIKNKDIKMVSEKIAVTMHDIVPTKRVNDASASVVCDFIFENTSDKTIIADVGFPTIEVDNAYGNEYISLDNFKVFINENMASVNIKKETLETWYTEGAPNNKGERYRYWYTWKTVFPPKQRISIRNTYSTLLSSDSLLKRWFTYILVTGANWKGEIGEATIEIAYKDKETLRHRATNAKPGNFTLEDNKIVWRFTNLTPTENIVVYETFENIYHEGLSKYYNYLIKQMNNKAYDGNIKNYQTEDVEFIDLPRDVITNFDGLSLGNIYTIQSMIDDLGRIKAKMLRNEVFARHGRIFESDELSKAFSKTSWYKQNKNYSDSMLNDIERKNIQFIIDYEKKMGWRK